MGFDLYGRNPVSSDGEYFRNNVWWWRPLWEYVILTCDNILTVRQARDGTMNSGAVITKSQTLKIVRKLQKSIDNGDALMFKLERDKQLDSLEKEVCEVCGGTGKRKKPPKTGAGKHDCNSCDSTGKVDSFLKHYPFDVDNVQDFLKFCKTSGGFEIW